MLPSGYIVKTVDWHIMWYDETKYVFYWGLYTFNPDEVEEIDNHEIVRLPKSVSFSEELKKQL